MQATRYEAAFRHSIARWAANRQFSAFEGVTANPVDRGPGSVHDIRNVAALARLGVLLRQAFLEPEIEFCIDPIHGRLRSMGYLDGLIGRTPGAARRPAYVRDLGSRRADA